MGPCASPFRAGARSARPPCSPSGSAPGSRSSGGEREQDSRRPKPSPLSPEVERELRDRAKRELPARLLELAAEHGLTVARVSVRNQRWRWGSCSRNGHICLNWRLVQMPDSVRDYVMIHELMHLKRMDHSPKFWKLVAEACPDFETARAWLEEAGTGMRGPA